LTSRTKGTLWQDNEFTNPTKRKIEPTQSVAKGWAKKVVCGGFVMNTRTGAVGGCLQHGASRWFVDTNSSAD
jgi:hypothetical protein